MSGVRDEKAGLERIVALKARIMPLKIFNLTDHWFPDKIGGSCIYANRFHKLLSSVVDIETITLAGDNTPCEDNMVVHKVLHKTNFFRNRRTIRQLGCDSNAIWVVHSPWFFFHLIFAFGFTVRNRVVAVYHGPWYHEYYNSASAHGNVLAKIALSSVRYAIELIYCVYVKRFIFLSETMYRMTSKYLPIPKSKVHIIPMWSEKKTWDKPKSSNGKIVISTFRRLEPRMGLQDLLLHLNQTDLGDFTLHICGEGPYRNELTALVEKLRLQDKVKLRGLVSEREKFELIKESDAVIIPSRNLEGFSLLALEALENGSPLLLTEAVGFYEYIKDIDQDFVKKIDLDGQELQVRQFLFQGPDRTGLERIQARFDSAHIRQQLLGVLENGKANPDMRPVARNGVRVASVKKRLAANPKELQEVIVKR